MNTLQKFYDRFFSENDDADSAFNKFAIICNTVAHWIFLLDYNADTILDFIFVSTLSSFRCKGITRAEYDYIYEAYSYLRTENVETVRFIVRECNNWYEDRLDEIS